MGTGMSSMVPDESYAITHARFWVFNNWPGTTNDGSVYFKNYYVTKFSSETNSNIFTTAAPTEAPETTHPITTTVEPGIRFSIITRYKIIIMRLVMSLYIYINNFHIVLDNYLLFI